ncbi:MAG TPA: tol-pal system-associated acyl-CoA thioesterase [Lichenihabitans sp.]|jgi:acyl-CoA thioester hydrolase|nr:tol-pal system-associated acyl-CoA thioesterase [Lichenihabitans sp.]
MAPHRLAVRVYYEDTDFSGVVYHASYLRFFERGRTEFLRALGIGQAELFAGGRPLAFAVTHMTIDFRKAARMDDLIEVETDCVTLGRASLVMRQRLTRGADLLTEATVKIAAMAEGRVARLPGEIAARLARASAGAAIDEIPRSR